MTSLDDGVDASPSAARAGARDGGADAVFQRTTSVSSSFGRHASFVMRRAKSVIRRAASLGRDDDREEASRRAVLVLHGWRSNASVSATHAERLRLLARFERAHCVDGAIATERAADEATEALFDGPWFSWVDDSRVDLSGDTRAHEAELVRSLRAVVKFAKQHAPYECVVGFSQGGAIATLLSHPDVLEALDVPRDHALWKRAMVVCGGSSALITLAERALGVDLSSAKKTTSSVPSLHVFGFQDKFKPQGEELLNLFHTASMDENELIRHCVYFDGGHGVPAALKTDNAFHREIDAWMKIQSTPKVINREIRSRDAAQDLKYRSEKLSKGQRVMFTRNEDTAERGEGEPASNTTATAYDTANALMFKKPATMHTVSTPSGNALSFDTNYASVAMCDAAADVASSTLTILEALRQAPRESPLLRSLNESQPPMTYGAMLDFITDGDGDLRKIAVKSNDVVAYNVPPGPVGASAFLSIASQCTAAPLDPGIAEDDAYEALTSCEVTRVIIFRGTGSDAVEKAATRANISITWFAVSEDPSQPAGTYAPEVSEKVSSNAQRLELRNDSTGLLLRTSGTTSKAKVVPLVVGALTSNGAALARSLELTHKDVCINAMPLFHIGGLSCSILATIAAKASVTCCMKFDAQAFYDAITSKTSRAAPTWYSAIPTIHITVLQYGRAVSAGSTPSHSLRFIRSGAAALSHADAEKLHDFWGVPIVPTYSMSEQMPISGKNINVPLHERPDTVGQPLICSVALVSDSNCVPTAPFGQQGELVVSGENVMRGYANAEEANNKTYLFIGEKRYLRTGDIAKIDGDGFLYLTGRSKELIKRGGEQVSPLKVEAVLAQHPAVRVAVVFGVPSPLWGEEVGVAIVLVDGVKTDEESTLKSIKSLATSSKELSRFEVPVYWKIVADEDLPKTSTKKYKRAGLAEILGMSKTASTRNLESYSKSRGKPATTTIGLGGLRYCMAVGVMFNHIGVIWQGADERNPLTYGPAWWSAKATTFYFPATTFFILGGFTLSSALYGKEVKKGTWLSFYNSRFQTLYPLYLVSLICGYANVLAVCRPETFSSEFSWQPHNETLTLASGAVAQCQTSPVEMPYGAWLFMTAVVFSLGLQTWFPAWLLSSWFMYYTWFNGVYYFIIFVFPFMQNALARVKGDVRAITKWFAFYTCGVFVTAALLGVYYALPAWEEHDELGKTKSWKENMQNIYALSMMMFPPNWVPCVGTGMAAYFWYDAVRPYQTHRKKLYGGIADGLTLAFMAFHIAHFCDIDWPYPTHITGKMWEVTPEEHHAWDTGIKRYVWSVMITRLYSPLIAVWIALLSMPQGSFTTRFLESKTLTFLAPTSYGCFLFHQIVGQWYWWITRSAGSDVDVGHMDDWSWWAYPKEYYWFSPQPLPVAWYEFFLVVALVTAFAAFVDRALNARMTVVWIKIVKFVARLFGAAADDSSTSKSVASPEQSVLKAVASLTGVEENVSLDDSFDEIGLVSVGLPVLVGLINAQEHFALLSPSDIAGCPNLRAVVDIVTRKRAESETSAGVGRFRGF